MSKKKGRNNGQKSNSQQAKFTSNSSFKPEHNRKRLGTNGTFKLPKSVKRALAFCRPEVRSDLLYMMKEAELASLSFKNRRESSKESSNES